MARNKRKPHDPAKAEADREARRQRERADAKVREQTPARWGEDRVTDDQAATFERHGVDYALDTAGRLKRAHKADVWAQLHSRNALTDEQNAAVRRLEGDMIMRAGHGSADGEHVFVDRQGDAAAITDRQVEAGRRVDDALALVGPPSTRLLKALLEPGVEGHHVDWRSVVLIVTGETNDRAQAALLRNAAQSLAEVWPEVERREAIRRKDSAERRRQARDAA